MNIMNFFDKIWAWCKKEAVLSIALVLAVVSTFLVHPDREYLGYIDFHTLAVLFCLMAVMAGLQKLGVFQWVAERLLRRVKGVRSLVFILIMLCFFSSMIITNDVALITFVPFAFISLRIILKEEAYKLVVPVVVMQTIAANLGSMLTPIGNPQNLYLYGRSGMSFPEFVWFMLPLTGVAFALLAGWCLIFRYKSDGPTSMLMKGRADLSEKAPQILVYIALFALSILTVAHVLPYWVTLLITVVVVLLVDGQVLKQVDYALLFTFIGFFVFIGNMGRVPEFNQLLSRIIVGNEVLTGILASQVISNVPAALLLSGFTSEYKLLIMGTNIGGLGTIIASMASLISFKYIGREYKELRGRYLLYFTLANLFFLAIYLVCLLAMGVM